jgi:aryl-alcohol dehydrogenase-like predicted oxidoreductase
MTSLHVLVQERKVLYLGISDTPAWVVAAANTFAMCVNFRFGARLCPIED